MTQNKINLRALEPEDIDLLYSWENDKQIWQISDLTNPIASFIHSAPNVTSFDVSQYGDKILSASYIDGSDAYITLWCH